MQQIELQTERSPRPVERAELALAQAMIPGSARVVRADEGTVRAVHELVEHIDPRAPGAWARAMKVLDSAARPANRPALPSANP